MGIEHVLLWLMIFMIVAIGIKERRKDTPYTLHKKYYAATANNKRYTADLIGGLIKVIAFIFFMVVQIAWFVFLYTTLSPFWFVVCLILFSPVYLWPIRMFYNNYGKY